MCKNHARNSINLLLLKRNSIWYVTEYVKIYVKFQDYEKLAKNFRKLRFCHICTVQNINSYEHIHVTHIREVSRCNTVTVYKHSNKSHILPSLIHTHCRTSRRKSWKLVLKILTEIHSISNNFILNNFSSHSSVIYLMPSSLQLH